MELEITNPDGNKVRMKGVKSCMNMDRTEKADADLPTGCVQLWLDEANNQIKVKAKYLDDTVKSATLVTLT